MISVVARKMGTLFNHPLHAIRSKFRPRWEKKSKIYIEDVGLKKYLDMFNDRQAMAYDPIDLCNLHRLIIERKPRRILEFGSGYSTVAIAHAVMCNGKLTKSGLAKFISMEGSERWFKSTSSRVPEELKHLIDLRYSKPIVIEFKGNICHRHSDLPNMSPDFIYLDGPSPYDVEGERCGLKFVNDDGTNKTVMSADILFYEPFMRPGSTVIVDTRYNNVSFIRSQLLRNWKFKWDSVTKIVQFTLNEWNNP